MIGKHRDGGYAEFILMPERSVFRLPDEIPFAQGAIMMCSSATSLHALRKARLQPGERVAVLLMVPTSLFWAAAQIRAFAHVLSASSSLEIELTVGLAALFVVIYTGVGGLLADAATDGRDYPAVDRLQTAWVEFSARLVPAVNALSDEGLSAPSPIALPHGEQALLDALRFIVWHETLHLGQVSMLRSHHGLTPLVTLVRDRAAVQA